MLKWCATGLLCLSLSSFYVLGQGATTLEIFSSPDGTFQFVYPQTYQLLEGERFLKATQGRYVGIPVCDFSTAIVCVIHPVETPSADGENNTRFEGAGLSVRAVAGATTEADCLTYADQLARSHGENVAIILVAVNDRVFRHAFVRKTILGHVQAADSYRIFHRQNCYEVLIEVSMADEPALQKAAQSTSLGDAKADSARESLRLILSSMAFPEQ